MVGNDQMNNPWLDESLTQYITGTYYLDKYGDETFTQYRQSWISRWERANRSPIPIGLPAERYTGREYSAIVYGRGPLFVEALANKMGQSVFDEFLRDYFTVYRWGIVTPENFKQSTESHCGCDLKELFAEWVDP
jgi:aminopeptidase N